MNGQGVQALGVGLAFNPALAAFVEKHADHLDYLEISPERFWRDRGPQCGRDADRYAELAEAVAQLEAVRSDLPLVAHGVGLSIAAAGPLDVGHVEQVARWTEKYGFAWYSEHLAYSRLGPDQDWRGIGIMVPPVYDRATLADLTGKLRQVRAILGLDVLVENAVDYAPAEVADFAEPEFLMALSRQSGCGVLLDLHNIHTNAVNLGRDASAAVDAMDLGTVGELHIAGGEPLDGFWTDAHSGRCPAKVWELLERVLSRPNGVRGVTLEIDESYASRLGDDVILEELERARALCRAAGAAPVSNVA